jgi:transaldolase
MSVSVGIHADVDLARTVREIALEGYKGPGETHYESQPKYAWLRDLGSRIWFDTGDADAAGKVWAAEAEALTTNNTLVNQVVKTGAMDGLISYSARRIREVAPDISERDLIIEIAFLVNARLALDLVQRFGARVSVELHPDVGFDVPATLAFARRYYDINPKQFYVKVPLTPDGFVSVRRLSKEGIPVNFTLGFSARQNYFAARFSRPRFVNVFLGRLNQLVDENEVGKPENIGEKTAVASFEAVRGLRQSQAGVSTLQIAASIRSGSQVPTLAGIDVLTIPPKAAQEYLYTNISQSDVHAWTADELQVDLDLSRPVEANGIMQLWEIDEQFVAFAEDAVRQGDQMVSGAGITKLAEKHGVDLFYEWSAEDRRKIREHGKIPDLSQWPGVPVDDLMSISALESFAKDQEELDSRITQLLAVSS